MDDPHSLLAPEIAAVIGAVPFEHMTDDVVASMRRAAGSMPPSPSDALDVVEEVVSVDPPVTVRISRPRGDTRVLPCVYSMHGGGYVIGMPAMDDGLFAQLCPRLGVVGVSVDYRLAPETPYPGGLEDSYRGLRWVFDHADDLGIDPAHVGVHGLSAGGGMAAALALCARDRAEVPLAFQVLDSAMLDDRQRTLSSRTDGLPVWSRESNEYGWRAYLGDLYGTDAVPYTAAPARADDLTGLPPSFVSVGAVDGFRDENVEYAMRLAHAGVATELHVYPGACHGYQLAAESPVVRQSRRDLEEWLARQLL